VVAGSSPVALAQQKSATNREISEFGARFVRNLALPLYGGIVRATPGSCRTTALASGSGFSSRGHLGQGSRKSPGQASAQRVSR
jgi:hypothetical protein